MVSAPLPVSIKTIEFQFCLLPHSTTTTPKDELKLFQAGLGRRMISIAETACHEEVTIINLYSFVIVKANIDTAFFHLNTHLTKMDKLSNKLHNSVISTLLHILQIEQALVDEYPQMKNITGDWMLHKSPGMSNNYK